MELNLNLSLYILKDGICIHHQDWVAINNKNFPELMTSVIGPTLTKILKTDTQLVFGGLDNLDTDEHDLSYIYYDLMHFGHYVYWSGSYDIIICQSSLNTVQYIRNGIETIISITEINNYLTTLNDVITFNLSLV